jgi:hypothetical protein
LSKNLVDGYFVNRTWTILVSGLRKQHGGAQDIFNRIKQGAVDPSNAIDDPGHYCEHCRCHLAARQPLLGPSYGNSCATAIRGLAAECARTEEELQLQLEALKAQLESKDKFRGKNLIPTVLHRSYPVIVIVGKWRSI